MINHLNYARDVAHYNTVNKAQKIDPPSTQLGKKYALTAKIRTTLQHLPQKKRQCNCTYWTCEISI